MGFFDSCQPNQGFNAYMSAAFPREPTMWHTIDWDQRRYISTNVPEYVDMSGGGEEVEERIMQSLAGLVDELDGEVNLVNFLTDGDFISTSSDARDDTAVIPLYCPIDMIPEQYRSGRVVSKTDLVEFDRLSQNWHELKCWLRLSGHPNIVPLEGVATDHEDVPEHGTDIEVVVGFTSAFVPGKTLHDRPSRLFKLKYLEHLIEVVDDLNLKFGIVHQDIASRNLLVNSTTDTLQLFDFSCSGRLGWKGPAGQPLFSNSGSFQIDLKGLVATVYEVITQDTQLAEQILLGADISTLEEKGWIKHPDVSLDKDVAQYRRTIRDWLQQQNQPENLITHYTQASNPLEWPQPWRPEIPFLDQDGKPLGQDKLPVSSLSRAILRALGLRFVEWERPAHNKIPDGFPVLGDGTLVAQADLDRDLRGQPAGRVHT